MIKWIDIDKIGCGCDDEETEFLVFSDGIKYVATLIKCGDHAGYERKIWINTTDSTIIQNVTHWAELNDPNDTEEITSIISELTETERLYNLCKDHPLMGKSLKEKIEMLREEILSIHKVK